MSDSVSAKKIVRAFMKNKAVTCGSSDSGRAFVNLERVSTKLWKYFLWS